MSATALRPFRLDAFAVGIIALVGDAAVGRCPGEAALCAAWHDRYLVSVQPVASRLWLPLISRGEALAVLPGRASSAEEVLSAVMELAGRIAPPGHRVDVGAGGVFLDAAAGGVRVAAPVLVVARGGWGGVCSAVPALAA